MQSAWLAVALSFRDQKPFNWISGSTPSATLPAAQYLRKLFGIFSYLASTLIVLPWIFNLSVIALLNLQAFDEFLISKYCHLLSENRKILLLSSRFIVWACIFANSFYIQQIIGMHRRKRCESFRSCDVCFQSRFGMKFRNNRDGNQATLLTGVIFVMNDRRFCIVGSTRCKAGWTQRCDA